jgi:NAD dependent epimerase/dehydratase family enzyme
VHCSACCCRSSSGSAESKDDEIAAIRAALDDERLVGPVNIAAPNPVTNAEFAHTLGQVLHRPTVLPTPLLPLKLRYGTELVESLLLASQRVAPAQLEAVNFPFRFPVLETALQHVVSG